MVYIDVVRPLVLRKAYLFDLACVLGGSLFIALCAQVAVRLPFSPVPVTGQTLAVLLVAAVLGSRRGVLAVLAYLAEGASGLPVFASGGAGLLYALGPTGGYLVGFVAAAGLTGALAECGWDRRIHSAAVAMLVGNAAIYLCGIGWLSMLLGLDRAVAAGLLPFIPGDVAKLAIAALLLPSAWRFVGSARS